MKKDQIKKVISHPQVAVIVVIFTLYKGKVKVLLYEREREPLRLSLPAGLIFENESLDEAANRVLFEKTGVKKVFLEQLYTFGEPDRDPYERTIGVTYYALFNYDEMKVKERGAGWHEVSSLEELAFDHNRIVDVALKRVKSKILYSNIAHGVLPDTFTLTDLQNVYEAIVGQDLDKRNFRKKILSLNILEDTKKKTLGKRQRPAKLYKFKTRNVILFKSEL